jgi:hypothetical protein
MTGASKGPETKTPPERGSGGVRKFERSKWDQPIPPPRERARGSTLRAQRSSVGRGVKT